ncbi:SMEK domain-containing protein [Pseudoalteromonas sp. Of7M-16]|uniref:SMEK domain-containing protein n=1 Tax=Pseudoalteromonas sp. Of7M-16 TaxID=2917756 RepID=UPI001EF5EC57|nr:SMEK domain-containing protein [Pseudoalteromonas sp. Of7M-16]MCG7548801.1 SMEK domain-containing protein [Pseudoalteromonas sp. Of7M-16]
MEAISIENELREVVSRIITQVDLATKQGRLDVNLTLEDALIPILKEVFQLPRLVNLNAKQKNYPGIDLGDEHDRIAIQVTSTTNIEKVKKSIKVFLEHGFESNFDELIILVLSQKQKSYSQDAIDKVTGGKINFSAKSHIVDLSDVLAKITSMRLPAQKRMLHEFKLILGDIDGYIQFTNVDQPVQKLLTTNLAHITFPDEVFVAEVIVDFKDVLARAKAGLGFKKRRHNKKTLIKLAMVLNGSVFDGWVFHEGKIFSFINPEYDARLKSLVDPGTIEPLDTRDLTQSEFVEYTNVFKELMKNSLKDDLREMSINYHNIENNFYFLPKKEEDETRKIDWVGKKKATRTVFEKKMQTKDPSKVLYFKHLSFGMSFYNIGDDWYCLIVPNWLFTYNLHKKSYSHDKFLAKQKRLDTSGTVRNLTRFIVYFLGNELANVGSNFSISPLVQLECEYPDFDADDVMEDSDES